MIFLTTMMYVDVVRVQKSAADVGLWCRLRSKFLNESWISILAMINFFSERGLKIRRRSIFIWNFVYMYLSNDFLNEIDDFQVFSLGLLYNNFKCSRNRLVSRRIELVWLYNSTWHMFTGGQVWPALTNKPVKYRWKYGDIFI